MRSCMVWWCLPGAFNALMYGLALPDHACAHNETECQYGSIRDIFTLTKTDSNYMMGLIQSYNLRSDHAFKECY